MAMPMSISELQDRLFEIPPDIISPVELSKFLKGRLGRTMEENVHLKQYIHDIEEELGELRILKLQNTETKHAIHTPQEEQSVFANKFLEISKKNRNMTAEIEGLKSKIKKLVAENEKMRRCPQFETTNTDTSNDNNEKPSTAAKSEAVMLTSQQLTHVTNKMIEYQRQCHQMKIDLRHMSKALCQEVGEGVTVQTLSNCINSCNWRGRQQQIISLQQKITDLQTKVDNCQCQSGSAKLYGYDIGGAGEGYLLDNDTNDRSCRGTSSEELVLPRLNNSVHTLKNSAAQRPFVSLHQQELKKHEQIQRLTSEMNESKAEIKFLKNELQASKSRCKILDAQVKTLRFQVNESSTNLQNKLSELDNSQGELKQLKQELKKVKSREINSRGQNCAELHEVQHLLSKERVTVHQLQSIISENQETLANIDKERSYLQQKLDAVLSSCPDGIIVSNDGIVSKIASLEAELSQAARIIETSETEYKKLLALIKDSNKGAEEEKSRLVNIQLRLSKAFAVLERADECILQCLDGAQVCDEKVLKQVEETRALIRELKIGELISLEMNAGAKSSDAKNLNTHISMLKKELVVLREQLQKVAAEKKRDLKNFTIVAEEIRREYVSNFPLDKYLNLNKEETVNSC